MWYTDTYENGKKSDLQLVLWNHKLTSQFTHDRSLWIELALLFTSCKQGKVNIRVFIHSLQLMVQVGHRGQWLFSISSCPMLSWQTLTVYRCTYLLCHQTVLLPDLHKVEHLLPFLAPLFLPVICKTKSNTSCTVV